MMGDNFTIGQNLANIIKVSVNQNSDEKKSNFDFYKYFSIEKILLKL